MTTGLELTVPDTYKAYAQVFSKADWESMPSHSSQDLLIELLNGKQPPWGPIYNLFKNQFATPQVNLKTQLRRGQIRTSKSLAVAPSFFVPKSDGTLWLCIKLVGLN